MLAQRWGESYFFARGKVLTFYLSKNNGVTQRFGRLLA